MEIPKDIKLGDIVVIVYVDYRIVIGELDFISPIDILLTAGSAILYNLNFLTFKKVEHRMEIPKTLILNIRVLTPKDSDWEIYSKFKTI